MFHTTRDDEEESDDEDAAIADDALDEIGDDFAEEDILGGDAATVAADAEDEDDEKDVDFDRHDDVDPI